MQYLRRHYKIILLFCLFAAAYLVHSIRAGSDPKLQAQYHISSVQATGLLLTIAIPYIAIWFTALFGYLRLRAYAGSIKQSRDGRGFWQISHGVLWLIFWLPINTLVGDLAARLAAHHPQWTTVGEYANTYISVLMLLVAFFLLNEGAKKVLRLTRVKQYEWQPKLLVGLFLIMAGLYIFLAFQNPAGAAGTTHRLMPDWLLMDTVVLPRLLGWYLGLQAVWHLYLYTKFISGRLYRLPLTYLTTGLTVVVLGLILLRYLSTMSAITKSGLSVILPALYLLLIIISGGYMLLARGARELARLEQV